MRTKYLFAGSLAVFLLSLPAVAQAQCQGYCESWAVYDSGTNTISGYSNYEISGYDPVQGPYEVYVESYIWDPEYNYTYLGSAVGYENVELSFSYTPQLTGDYTIAGYNSYAVYEGEWNSDGESSCSVYASPPRPDPTPNITGVSPPSPWQEGQQVSVTVSGTGFGTSPTLTITWPDGSTYNGSCSGAGCDTSISASVTVPSDQSGDATLQITSTGYGQGFLGGGSPTSNTATVGIDPEPGTGTPTYMIITQDYTGKCSGCTAAAARVLTYRVMVSHGVGWSGLQGTGGAMCETNNYPNYTWSCTGSMPTISVSACKPGQYVFTDSDGNMPGQDQWTLSSDQSPAGCGYDNLVDVWNAAGSPATPVGKMSGYMHTDAISINGSVATPGTSGQLTNTCMNSNGAMKVCP